MTMETDEDGATKYVENGPFFEGILFFLEETAICIRTFMYVHVSIIIAQFWLHFV